MSTDYKLFCREHNLATDVCSRQATGMAIVPDGRLLACFIYDHQGCKLEVAREGSEEFHNVPPYQGN